MTPRFGDPCDNGSNNNGNYGGPAIIPTPDSLNQPQGLSNLTSSHVDDGGGMGRMSASSTFSSFLGTPTGDLSTKRESYKDRKRNYQLQKKKVAEEILSTLNDPTMVVMQDWLKVRGTLKGWTKLWCELKPGLLILYKSEKIHKSGQWVGTILLNVCDVIERPSKKNGFCFKLFNPMEHSIWASRGPKGESFGAFIQPLPIYYLIFRAPSEMDGKNWMDALELSLRYSSILSRNNERSEVRIIRNPSQEDEPSIKHKLNESEIEQHFKDHDLDDDTQTDHEEVHSHEKHSSDTDSDRMGPSVSILTKSKIKRSEATNEPIVETVYEENDLSEEINFGFHESQSEEIGDENKSLIWSLLKQVRPGMDLSKVVLPTFILEPRSFLEKLTDYYFHCDILSKAVLEDDPFTRIIMVTKWYLSGLYKKPKGMKKPYNPILGERYRCYWNHPDTHSRTFYIAEQVSHHPPISAFYVTNRKDGFCICGSILAKSKFYGNSVSAILDGTARLSLLTRGEDYRINMPFAHCKGILMGTLTFELGGKIEIACEKTGYSTHIEFKLKPFLSSNECYNSISGKIKLGKETIALINGHWDTIINVTDKRTGHESVLWDATTSETRSSRLTRFIVPLDLQDGVESEKLWRNVSIAILKGDQIKATEEKTILEEAQRKAAKERQAKMEPWICNHFLQDPFTGEWIYKQADSRPWDPRTDVLQYERDFVIQTKTRHRTPKVACRTNSVISVETGMAPKSTDERRSLLCPRLTSSIESQASGESSSPERSSKRRKNIERLNTQEVTCQGRNVRSSMDKQAAIRQLLDPIQKCQIDCLKKMERMEKGMNEILLKLEKEQKMSKDEWHMISLSDVFRILIISFIVQFFIYILWYREK